MNRNGWPISIGIAGRFAAEYALKLPLEPLRGVLRRGQVGEDLEKEMPCFVEKSRSVGFRQQGDVHAVGAEGDLAFGVSGSGGGLIKNLFTRGLDRWLREMDNLLRRLKQGGYPVANSGLLNCQPCLSFLFWGTEGRP